MSHLGVKGETLLRRGPTSTSDVEVDCLLETVVLVMCKRLKHSSADTLISGTYLEDECAHPNMSNNYKRSPGN